MSIAHWLIDDSVSHPAIPHASPATDGRSLMTRSSASPLLCDQLVLQSLRRMCYLWLARRTRRVLGFCQFLCCAFSRRARFVLQSTSNAPELLICSLKQRARALTDEHKSIWRTLHRWRSSILWEWRLIAEWRTKNREGEQNIGEQLGSLSEQRPASFYCQSPTVIA